MWSKAWIMGLGVIKEQLESIVSFAVQQCHRQPSLMLHLGSWSKQGTCHVRPPALLLSLTEPRAQTQRHALERELLLSWCWQKGQG